MSGQINSQPTIHCLNCQKILSKKQIWKKIKTCSRSCGTSYRYKVTPPKKKEKEIKYTKSCSNCGKNMNFYTISQMKKQNCCSVACASKLKWEKGSTRERYTESMKKHNRSQIMKDIHKRNPNLSKMSSQRMKENNPMKNIESVEKMRKKLAGRTFLSRGGNGKLTPQQILLHQMLGDEWIMELPIPTREYKGTEKSLPFCYKVDIAHPKQKVIIEIDGKSHKTEKWKFLDKRKTNILTSLGWKVLRFWNEEITETPQICLQKIQEFMI
jgi:hypothetical protein